jgi:hypothetical protein
MIKIVAEPLHQRTGNGDGAFETIDRRFAADLVGHRGHQAMP